MIRAVGVIPARLGSTRLSEKVLRLINGKPMVQHVWSRARQSQKLADVIVACDDVRIQNCIQTLGGKAVLTRADHPNGTSRVAEIAEREKADVLINIQGDEPLIHPQGIDQLVESFEKDPSIQVATLAVQRRDREDYENPNVVKVLCDQSGDAIYFSRSPIPYYRDQSSAPFSYLKHLGIYGYRREFLLQFVKWPVGNLENKEKLEQLRIVERGIKIRVIETPFDSWSVDTAEDLETVESKIKNCSREYGVA